jgi:hypothetical protein
VFFSFVLDCFKFLVSLKFQDTHVLKKGLLIVPGFWFSVVFLPCECVCVCKHVIFPLFQMILLFLFR